MYNNNNNPYYAQLLHQQQLQQQREEQQQLHQQQLQQQHAYARAQHGAASSTATEARRGYTGQQQQQSSSYLSSMQLQEQQQQALMRAHLEQQQLQAQARLRNRQHAQGGRHAGSQQQQQQQQQRQRQRQQEYEYRQRQGQQQQGQAHAQRARPSATTATAASSEYGQRASKRARQDLYKCDHCGLTPILHERYTCNVCKDFDACRKCAISGKHDPKHQLRKVMIVDESGGPSLTATATAIRHAAARRLTMAAASTSGSTSTPMISSVSTSFNKTARATNGKGQGQSSGDMVVARNGKSQLSVTTGGERHEKEDNLGDKLKQLNEDVHVIFGANKIGKLPSPLGRKQASIFIDIYQAGLYHLESYVHHTPGSKLNTRTTRWLNQLVVLTAMALARIPLPNEATPAVVLATNATPTPSYFVFVREPKLNECKWEHIVPTLLCATAQMCSADRKRYFQDTPEEAEVRRTVQPTWGDKEEETALKTCTKLETVQHGIVGGEMIESSKTVGMLFRTYMTCVRKVFRHAMSNTQDVIRDRAGGMLEGSEQVFRIISAQMGIDARFTEGPLFDTSSTSSPRRATSAGGTGPSSPALPTLNQSAPSVAAAAARATQANGVNNQSRNKPIKDGSASATAEVAVDSVASGGEGEGGEGQAKFGAKSTSSSALADNSNGNGNGNTSRIDGRRARAKASTESSIDQSLIGPPEDDAKLTQEQALRTASAMRREISRARRSLNSLVQLMRNGLRDVSAAVDTVTNITNNNDNNNDNDDSNDKNNSNSSNDNSNNNSNDTK